MEYRPNRAQRTRGRQFHQSTLEKDTIVIKFPRVFSLKAVITFTQASSMLHCPFYHNQNIP